jgi:Heterokaryon incompatibility protein (HET)
MSYKWGDRPRRSEDCSSLRINNHEISIRPSLAEALLCFREQLTKPLPISIDALCINQTDVQERGAQLQMMKQIYEISSGMWVWLGPAACQSDLTMDVIDEMQRYHEEIKGTISRPVKWIFRLLHDPNYKEHWQALCEFFKRSY